MKAYQKLLGAAILVGSSMLAAAPAAAAALLFELNGSSFTLDSDPVPDESDVFFFGISGVSVTDDAGSTDTVDLLFRTSDIGGGFGFLLSGTPFLFDGPQLFTGTAADPSFLTGMFALTGSDLSPGAPDGTLTIRLANVGSAVPEPATWAMMILGFGLVGGSMRMQRTVRKAVIAN